MGSTIENVTVIDSNALANEILCDINDVAQMENTLDMELSSEDLFRIDCAILSSLRNTQDFSRDLLARLEAGLFEEVAEKPPKTPDKTLENIQQKVMADITAPIHNMFDEMEDFVVAAFAA